VTEGVQALVYDVRWAPNIDYKAAPPVHDDTSDFSLDLSGRELRVVMKCECPTIDEARNKVEGYLRAWEVHIGLVDGPDAVRFAYRPPSVSVQSPGPTTGTGPAQVTAHAVVGTQGSVERHTSRLRYDPPTKTFRADGVVEALYARYSRHLADGETLTAMAYFCLTVLERSVSATQKARQGAARRYGIAFEVLDRLGMLCAKRGSESEARKAPHGLAFSPLSSCERAWILSVVRTLITRAGEVASHPNAQLPPITMADLPSLTGHP
jgi:hypothetical protein